jgi:phosphatidylglycerol lysyltransferase
MPLHVDREAKRSFLVWIATLVTLGSGVANLYSVVTSPPHHALMEDLLPLGSPHFSRSFTLILGLALIVSAINIYRRKRRAFQIVLLLASGSALSHLIRGYHYEQAASSLVLIGLLLLAHKSFTVRSRQPDLRSGLIQLTVAFVVAFGYGVAGFWLLDEREFGINFNWLDSIHRTLLFLALAGDSQLVPHTRYAEWFLESLYLMTVVAVGYGLFSLFRPIIYHYRTLPQERARAREIITGYGRSSLDYFKLWPDKSYFFNASSSCVVAYSVSANFAIALADPVGPGEEIEETVREFARYCEDNGWNLAFHQTLPDFLPLYRRLGFRRLKIGDDAIVDLTSFDLEGRPRKKLRQKINQLEKAGIRIRLYEPPLSAKMLAQLKEVSDEWLQIPGRRERTFTLGSFEQDYVRSTPVMTAEDMRGRALAFVNLIPSYHPGTATIDLMRHRQDAPNGIMDYLFVKLFLHCRGQGFAQFDLGMAPMSGFQEREEASAAERTVHRFFQQFNLLFSFAGLKNYKAKFATSWEPRYLIYRHVLDLPKMCIALNKMSETRARRKRGKEFDDDATDDPTQVAKGEFQLFSSDVTRYADFWADRYARKEHGHNSRAEAGDSLLPGNGGAVESESSLRARRWGLARLGDHSRADNGFMGLRCLWSRHQDISR